MRRCGRRSKRPATRPHRGAMAAATENTETLRLELEGMTCASCAARIEKKLNRLDGVEATVNFATEQATVHARAGIAVDELVAAVESAGYGAQLAKASHGHHHHDEPLALLTRRLKLAVALTLPVVLLAIVPPLRFSGWEWLELVLSTPVVFYSGIGFHRAAVKNARYLAATMDTLISLGTTAAWAWSTVVLVAGIDADVYFEVAAVVTTLIVLGRYLESRAKGRSSQAIKKLFELGAKEARVLRDGQEVLVPVAALQVGDRPVDADRRIGAGRGRARERDRRCDRQQLWATVRARDQGRRRHRAGTDRTAGRGGAVGQGSGAASRRPHLGDLRADRDRDLALDAGRLASLRRRRGHGLHRRRLRPDHRLPLRPWARDADRADGRHRSRRADGRADQRPGDPRADAQSGHDRARQDRHRHRGKDGAGRSRLDGRCHARRGAAARRGGRGRLRAPDRPGCRARRAGRAG